MQPLNHSAYLALREGATVIEADGTGEKVLQLPDGRFLKLFRRKRLVTSAALFPYAQRFADNARRLGDMGIATPQVVAVYRVKSIERDAVYYEPLPGKTVRQLMHSPGQAEPLRRQFGAFVAQLHTHGVYFRSLHLGNVILTPQGGMGLIDIADLNCQWRTLSASKRLRNFQHMLRYAHDREWLRGTNAGHTFLEAYQQALPSSRPYTRLLSTLGALFAPSA
ncbi:toluene tolerance protein [Pseudomonas typographi]|uniref:Toluene tolerance protein n=1 Tax=Pseudomonas typographi TaxID=2715964 RepID=A0ABR7YVX2_9PSED|nr:toluene tolerance protein [Pseudomonas typographi]MBD1549866.1 toluene tolerance protein [Pseudomonas typographi]MBD1585247.1 toluene tolerance protein [Pseudomonas typographi]MBD1597294.1 toluene tolerance protein [Pseudomonas typographi]